MGKEKNLLEELSDEYSKKKIQLARGRNQNKITLWIDILITFACLIATIICIIVWRFLVLKSAICTLSSVWLFCVQLIISNHTLNKWIPFSFAKINTFCCLLSSKLSGPNLCSVLSTNVNCFRLTVIFHSNFMFLTSFALSVYCFDFTLLYHSLCLTY